MPDYEPKEECIKKYANSLIVLSDIMEMLEEIDLSKLSKIDAKGIVERKLTDNEAKAVQMLWKFCDSIDDAHDGMMGLKEYAGKEKIRSPAGTKVQASGGFRKATDL